jgi:uncharacterized membrane protein
MITTNWMKHSKSVSKFLLASLMLGAGTMHFVRPDFFERIVPPCLPWQRELVYLSGICEVVLGLLLLVPSYSRVAAWGIIALLIAVFPANIYLYQHQELLPASPAVHFLRLPLQVVLILWAYWHTRPRSDGGVPKPQPPIPSRRANHATSSISIKPQKILRHSFIGVPRR